jgi:acyl carrier protein
MTIDSVDKQASGGALSPAQIPGKSGAMKSREELLAMFRRLATEVVEKDFGHVAEGTIISELGIDSLGMLEIIGSMERELKIQIPDEALSGITTVKDLLEVVAKRAAKS